LNVALIVFSAMALLGANSCRGCDGCGNQEGPNATAEHAGSGTQGKVSDPSASDQATELSHLDILERFAALLPVNTDIVAVFSSDTLKGVLEEITESFPVPALMEDKTALPGRVSQVYGLNLDDLGRYCAMSLIKRAGPLLACEFNGKTSPPPGNTRWTHDKAHGHNVMRGEANVYVGVIKDWLVIGSGKAIQRLSLVDRDDSSSLETVVAGKSKVLSGLAAADPWGKLAVFFIEPSVAPWCDDVSCEDTAIFIDPGKESMLVVNSRDGLSEEARAKVDVFWTDVKAQFVKVCDTEMVMRPVPIPDRALKKADLLVRRGEIAVRGHQVTLKGPGYASLLATVLNPDLIRQFLAPPQELMK